jgi:hypothetical protein
VGVRVDLFVGDEQLLRALMAANDRHALLTQLRAGIPGADQVLAGERRWWVGGIIDWARRSRLFPADARAQIETALAEIAGPFGCGIAEPPKSGVAGVDDLHLCFWETRTLRAVLAALRLLIASRIDPPDAPPGKVGIAPEPGPAWRAWISETAAKLAMIDDGAGDRRGTALLSFCG